jgi:hypothetical protein
MPKARSVFPGDFVTNHDELTQFLASQQKQIKLLEANLRNLTQKLMGSSSDARLQAIPDLPDEFCKALACIPDFRDLIELVKQSEQVEPPSSGLQWTENRQPNEECRYNHCKAETPFGRFLITWKGWKRYDDPTVDETPWGDWYGVFNSVDDAKTACQREFDVKLAVCAALSTSTQSNP